MFVDSHAHLDGPEFDADRDEVISRATAVGVNTILNVGTGDPHSGTLERAITLGDKYQHILTAIGVHPHDARFFDSKAEERVLSLIKSSPRIVAWGEIGLDFHYDNSPRDVQLQVFRRQLQLARDVGLPIVVHTREAEQETFQILSEEWASAGLPGIMHCFSGSLTLARNVLDLGLSISFSGIVTFKKAEDLREVARQVPLDRLLIETDCPYLTPVPYRGKRNEPAFVVEVARCLADLHGVTLEEIGKITSRNFNRVIAASGLFSL